MRAEILLENIEMLVDESENQTASFLLSNGWEKRYDMTINGLPGWSKRLICGTLILCNKRDAVAFEIALQTQSCEVKL